MKKSLVIGAAVAATLGWTVQAPAEILGRDYFDYTAGTDLAGNTAPVGGTWGFVGGASGNSSIDPTVSGTNLSHPDRLINAGGSVDVDGNGASGNAKLPGMPDQTAAGTNNGTVFYSFILNVSDITNTGTAATGSFIAGFSINDSLAPTVTSISTSAGVLLIRGDQDTSTVDDFYNLGVGVTENNADRVWNTTPLAPNTSHFIVVGYQFGAGADDDVATIYIDPDPSTYGAASAPGASATSDGAGNATAADRATLASFFFRNNSVSASHTLMDDLVIASTWAEATDLPEPSLMGLAGIGAMGLLARRRRA